MEVMSGWARQPLPQLIALLRIMTHPQPIPAHRPAPSSPFNISCRVLGVGNTRGQRHTVRARACMQEYTHT